MYHQKIAVSKQKLCLTKQDWKSSVQDRETNLWNYKTMQNSSSTIHSAEKSNNLVDTLWIPLFWWASCSDFHKFRGQALNSTIFVDMLKWVPLFSGKYAISAVNVHFFRGIQKSFLTRRTRTTTNKPFLRPRQRSLAVNNP